MTRSRLSRYPSITFRYSDAREEWKPRPGQRRVIVEMFNGSPAGWSLICDMITDIEHEIGELRKELGIPLEGKDE